MIKQVYPKTTLKQQEAVSYIDTLIENHKKTLDKMTQDAQEAHEQQLLRSQMISDCKNVITALTIARAAINPPTQKD